MALPNQHDPKLWLAMLHEIDAAGGSLPPASLYPLLRPYFPGITDADAAERLPSGGNRWTNRVQWARQNLVHLGYLERGTPGRWVVSEIGRAWVRSTWQGAEHDYSTVAKPAHVDPAPRSRSRRERRPAAATAPPVRLGGAADQICDRIVADQRKSSSPQLFEQDLSDAFAYLGFDARHVGGSREADIVLTAPLGQLSYSVVVDAKTAQSGRIPDSQINWSVVANYQKNRAATFAAVVGEDFSGGQLRAFADQYGVTLVTTAMLCEVVRLHARAPYNLLDLKDLFKAPGLATDGVAALRERHRATEQHWRLVAEIVETIAAFQAQATGGFALKVDQLHPVLYSKALGRGGTAAIPSLQDVSDAVGFLASPAVNVLAEVPGSGGAYQLAVRADIAQRRLRALARFVEDTLDATTASARAGPASGSLGHATDYQA
jgi:hypothetical protein